MPVTAVAMLGLSLDDIIEFLSDLAAADRSASCKAEMKQNQTK